MVEERTSLYFMHFVSQKIQALEAALRDAKKVSGSNILEPFIDLLYISTLYIFCKTILILVGVAEN